MAEFLQRRRVYGKGVPYMPDVIRRIAARRGELTRAQRRIAEHVDANYAEVAFFTAAQLSWETGVSESSVVRFARALGYRGYPEFQAALREMLRTRLTTVDRLRSAAADGREGDDIVHRVMTSDVEDIRITLRGLDRDALRAAVDALLSARRIHVIGGRGAAGLAHILGFGLNWILRNVTVPSLGAGDALDSMMTVGPADAVLALGFPRYARITVDMLKVAARRGARTIAVTDGAMSPLAEYADLLLIARSGQLSYADSLAAPLSLVNALLAAVGEEDPRGTVGALAEMESLWEEFGIYAEDPDRGEVSRPGKE